MNPAEQNYETHDSELLAIVEGFKQFRHYCEGASHVIQVLTDHNNLRGFMGVKQLNGRQARWATFLAAFDFVIEHRSSRTNPADGPSRRPDYEGVEQSTRHLLPTLQTKLAVWEDAPETTAMVRRVRIAHAAQVSHQRDVDESYCGPRSIVRAITNAVTRHEDPFSETGEDLASIIRRLQTLQSDTILTLRRSTGSASAAKDWNQENGLWYCKEALYVPDDSALRAQLMRVHYDDELASHFGRDKTEALLRRKYYWPELAKDVATYVKTCQMCQVMKPRRHRPYGEGQALPMPSCAWQEMTMDFITDLPPSKWHDKVVDAILVIVDRYTKMNIYVPTTKRCTSVELASILMEHVVKHYGVP